GTIVDVWAGGIVRSRQVSTGGGFASQNSLMQHVGLGEFAKADSIVIFWPADKNLHRQIDRYYDVPADQFLSYSEIKSGLNDNPKKNAVALYPSPAHNDLHIENLSSEGEKHFQIFDLLGRKQIDTKCSQDMFSLSVNALKPG